MYLLTKSIVIDRGFGFETKTLPHEEEVFENYQEAQAELDSIIEDHGVVGDDDREALCVNLFCQDTGTPLEQAFCKKGSL